jgi:hypothetical protein
MPERPYRSGDMQNNAYGLPRIRLPYTSVNRRVLGLNEPRLGGSFHWSPVDRCYEVNSMRILRNASAFSMCGECPQSAKTSSW